MSVATQLREIAARPVPDVQHYDPTDVNALMTPRPTPEPVPGSARAFPASADLTEAQRVYACEKPARKPRGPSKAKQAQDAAYLRGYDAALREKSAWPGALAALVLAGCSFIAGAVIF